MYARNGVQEYLVIQMYERQMDWFVLREGVYELLEPNEDGQFKSENFPGLWLDTAAFWVGNLREMLAVLQQGMNSPEHTTLVAQLNKRRKNEQSTV